MINNPLGIRRGSVWLIKLDPVIGHEQGKTRPCLVISDERFNNSKADLLVILPLTTKEQKNPWSILVCAKNNGIEIDSYVLCAQILTISKQRICSMQEIGYIDQKYFYLIEEKIKMLLALN